MAGQVRFNKGLIAKAVGNMKSEWSKGVRVIKWMVGKRVLDRVNTSCGSTVRRH